MSKVIVTAKNTDYRLQETNVFTLPLKKDTNILKRDSSIQYQEMLGFGGAFTESACYNLYRVNSDVRKKALELYFDPEKGLGYTMGRVSIHGCDFSLSSYTYIEEGDKELKTFDISRDFIYVIPTIKAAEEIAKTKIKLLASPWTPPAFMKDNNSLIRGGHLLPEFADAWANYYVKFIDKYTETGLDIWGVTVQNEPAAVQRWDSCIYSAEEEGAFLKNHLGPTLKNSKHHDVNILIWDHNRDVIIERVTPILSDPETAKYAWGTGFHWYVSETFENVGKVHEMFPDKGLLFTEGCIEGGVHLGAWHTGERYARNMIGDFLNYAQGYLDWNLFLDNTGGPNHVNNLCDAPIIIDIFPENLILETSYYYIGQFSKFVKPGSHRIECSLDNPNLKTVAFINPNKEIVTIILNESDVEEFVSTEEVTYQVLPHSIMTIIE